MVEVRPQSTSGYRGAMLDALMRMPSFIGPLGLDLLVRLPNGIPL